MDLRDRLRSAFGTAGEDRCAALPGEEVQTDLGAFWLATTDFPLDYRHGRRALAEMLDVDPARLVSLTGDEVLRTFSPRQAVFIDTETTSLSGGAGVFVFMAGIGFVHHGFFRVEQYFMRDYDEEPAMISAFNERCASATSMVSFFGKNFDRYRLEDRMTMQGMESAMPVTRHLDLYHVGRRLYQGKYPNLKLKTLEGSLLGFHRQGDLPGAECPDAYFDYLGGMDTGRMSEVFEHNLWDIMSLVVLSAEVDAFAAKPVTSHDQYTLACVHMRNRNENAALPLLEQTCQCLPPGPESFDAHMRLLSLLKRSKEHARVEKILEKALDMHPENPEVLTEMAKFLEHQRREIPTALEFALRARESLERFHDGSARTSRLLLDSRRRIERLKRKASAL